MLLTGCLLLGGHQPPLHLAHLKLLGLLEGLQVPAARVSACHVRKVSDRL
jgi:hypothetical protein